MHGASCFGFGRVFLFSFFSLKFLLLCVHVLLLLLHFLTISLEILATGNHFALNSSGQMLYRVDKTLFSLVFKLSTSTSPQLTSFSSSDHICHYFNLFCFFLSVPVRFLLQNFQSLLWLIFLFLFSVSTSSFTLLLCLHFPSSSLHSAFVSFQFYYLFYAFHPLTLLYCTLSLATSHTPFAPPFPLFPVFLSPCLPTPSFSSFTLLSFPPSLGYSRCYTVALGIAGEERPQAYVYSNVCVRITLCAYICLNMVVCACAHAQHICLCVYNATVYVSVCACVLY